jgi:hypothetical protein
MRHKYLHLLLPFLAATATHAATTLGGVTLGPLAGLSGDSTFATWHTMNLHHPTLNPEGIADTGGFPGVTMWTPKSSQSGSTESNTKLVKVSNGAGGGPYAAGSSIYYGGFSFDPNTNGGTLALNASTPLDGLKTVIFQIQIGEAQTYDFYNHALPTLTYTLTGDATLHTLAAAASSNFHKLNTGSVEMPTGTEPIYVNSYAMWFDFSAVVGAVESFSVSWTGVQHGQLYGTSIQQDKVALTSSILPAAVPEPSAILLGGVGFLFLLRRRK